MTCYKVPLSEISKQFRRKIKNDRSIYELQNIHLWVSKLDPIVPANIFSDHRISNEIRVSCDDRENYRHHKLEIDPWSFTSSWGYTHVISIYGCNFKDFDFNFLGHFKQLEILKFKFIFDFNVANWSTFPSMLHINRLEVLLCSPLNEWKQFPILKIGLYEILLSGFYRNIEINDEAMERILQWILESPTANTLERLEIHHNALTRVPLQIVSFKNLRDLRLHQYNHISTIRSGNFDFSQSSNILNLNLESIGVHTIEPASFQGKF